MNYDKHIGKINGDYQIISYEIKNEIPIYICRCLKCNHIRKLRIGDFNRSKNLHSAKFCKEDYFLQEGLLGDYHFVGDSGLTDSKGCSLYKIVCKICGNIKYKTSDNLQRCTYYHNSKNCGEQVLKDCIGNIIDDMKIIEYVGKSNQKNKCPIYLCECQICHRTKQMLRSNIDERKGTTHKTCSMSLSNQKYIDEFRSRWANMRDRTTNPNNKKYPVYGGRGIKSDDFSLFIDFYDSMYESFIEHVNLYGVHNTTLERIDVNLDYTPDNCTWATWEEQANNKQDTVYFRVVHSDGSETTEYGVGRYEKEHGLSHNFIFNRLYGIVKTNEYNGDKFYLVESGDNCEICAD